MQTIIKTLYPQGTPFKIIRKRAVIEKTGLAHSTIYYLMSKGMFPKQIKISPRIVGWREIEIDRWIEDRCAERVQ
jgi:prophage regulatory protein